MTERSSRLVEGNGDSDDGRSPELNQSMRRGTRALTPGRCVITVMTQGQHWQDRSRFGDEDDGALGKSLVVQIVQRRMKVWFDLRSWEGDVLHVGESRSGESGDCDWRGLETHPV